MSITGERLREINSFVNKDFSDCPEMTDDQLQQLRPSHYRKNKPEGVNVFIDNDIINWLDMKGFTEYQVKINDILRDEMLKQMTGSAS